MQETPLLLTVVLTTILFPFPADPACCFGFRKLCETIADITTYGNSDWRSLLIMPKGCENSTVNTALETITEDTFIKVPELTNVYIVDKVVKFEKNCFNALKDNLVYLSVIKNNISEISTNIFVDLLKVKKLVLRDNQIEHISANAFNNLPKLEILLLSGNKLQEVKSGILNTIDVIKTIDLSFNHISTIDQNAFPDNLILLNLKKNDITEIQNNTFSNLNSLEMLILSKNKIGSIQKGAFAGLSNLSKLDLSRNEIINIEKDTFSDLQELMFLYLKHNNIKVLKSDVFLKDLINLTDLELEGNQMSCLSEKVFGRMPNLEEISLGNNPWQCKCLDDTIVILSKRSISMSDDTRPKCS